MATSIGQYSLVFLPGKSHGRRSLEGYSPKSWEELQRVGHDWATSPSEGYGNQYWPIHSSILAWRTPLTEKPGRPQSTGSQSVGQDQCKTFFFFPVAALPQWVLSMKMVQLPRSLGLWPHHMCRDCLSCWSYGPIRVFFEPLVAGN